jgi:hypothetical protein
MIDPMAYPVIRFCSRCCSSGDPTESADSHSLPSLGTRSTGPKMAAGRRRGANGGLRPTGPDATRARYFITRTQCHSDLPALP